MLVKGFGTTAYLINRLREVLLSALQANINQCTDAWTAIVQGALLSAIERMHTQVEQSSEDM